MEHLEHFGLKRDPFQNEPDLRFYFDSTSHRDAQRRVDRALRQSKGLSILSGALEICNNYILNTLILDQAVLDAKGLRRNDVAKDPNKELTGTVPFDHLPIISDFTVIKK